MSAIGVQLKNRYIGDKNFYKTLVKVALPIAFQTGISNFVSMLDNVMVGLVGTEEMSGVSIVNDLVFVFTLALFGAVSGAGIFTAQYFGQKNDKGVRDTVRIKLIISGIITILGLAIFLFFYTPLIGMYLHDGSKEGDLLATFNYAKDYLMIIVLSFPFMAAEFSYSSSLRETGETIVPMRASFVAVAVNLVFNYLLIYGKFGCPKMGVRGAAVATVLSRVVQLFIEVIWVKKNIDKLPYFKGVFKSLKVPTQLLKNVCIMGLPLVFNETLWSAGVVMQKQSYSTRGLAVVASLNINSTMFNVFNISFLALGDAVAIIVGQLLGAGRMEEAKGTARKIMFCGFFFSTLMGVFVFLTAALYPMLYNTNEEVVNLAVRFIRFSACLMPINSLLHTLYFTLRSGGKTFITFLFDSAFLWVFMVPCAFVLSRYTQIDIVWVYCITEGLNLIKIIIGFKMFRDGIWINNIVSES